MAILTRVNGDLLPVAVMDSASYTNPGVINSVQDGATITAMGPKMDFFTIAAGGAVTADEMAAAIQTVQQLATLYIYSATIATGDLSIALYPTGSWQSNPIAATSTVAAKTYRILSIGTTNFTLIGAASNTVGLIFTSTGVGTGTGAVAEVTMPVAIQSLGGGWAAATVASGAAFTFA